MSICKEKFTCQRDGFHIRGTIWREETGILPAVILCHGFMANEGMCETYAKLFASMGYVAFIFDFCGGGLMSRSDGLGLPRGHKGLSGENDTCPWNCR
jgi:hypothetical protein